MRWADISPEMEGARKERGWMRLRGEEEEGG